MKAAQRGCLSICILIDQMSQDGLIQDSGIGKKDMHYAHAGPLFEIILHGIRILGNRHHRLKLRFSILSLNQGSVRSRKDSEAVPH